jgi:hypothetical protein
MARRELGFTTGARRISCSMARFDMMRLQPEVGRYLTYRVMSSKRVYLPLLADLGLVFHPSGLHDPDRHVAFPLFCHDT